MEHTDESVDVESRDLHSTKGTDTYDLESNADEDDSYSGSSGDERSETESSETGEDASDNIGAAVHSEGTQKATEPIVDLQSVSISDAISQMDEKKKRKATCNVDRSVQKKGSRPPIHRGAKATVTTQADTNGCYNQMHFQAQMDVTGTSRHLNAMCGVQPVMPMVPQMFQPMHLQPVYPMYGMSVGQTASSCYGMLQQSVGQSSRSCYSLLQQVEKAATDD